MKVMFGELALLHSETGRTNNILIHHERGGMLVATFQMFTHWYHFIMFTRNFVSESKSNNDG